MLLSFANLFATLATPALDQAEIDKIASRELARGGRATVVQKDDLKKGLHEHQFVVKNDNRELFGPLAQLEQLVKRIQGRGIFNNRESRQRFFRKLLQLDSHNCEGAAEKFSMEIELLDNKGLIEKTELEKRLIEDEQNSDSGIETPSIEVEIERKYNDAVEKGIITPPQVLPEIEPNA